MGFNFRGLAFKQSLMILAAITVVFGLIFGIMSYKTQNMLNKMTVENGEETSRANVNYIDKLFNASKLIGEDLSHKLTDHPMTKSDMDDFLLQSLFNARNLVPQVVAVVVAYEPGMGPENTEGEYMRLARFDHVDTKLVSGANYQDKEWYYSVRDGKTSRWQEPFIGEFVPEPIAVYTVPLFKKDKNGEDMLIGVLAVDMSIEFLKDEVGSIPVSNSGFALITTTKNVAVAYPKSLAEGKRNRDIIVREKRGQKQVEFDRKGRDSSGLFIGTVAGGEESAIYYTTIHSTNWTFMVVWPIQKYLEDQSAMRRLFLMMALGGYGVILVIILLISFRVAKPLKDLTIAARKLGRGNFDVAIPKITGHDEVAEFAWAFSHMLTEIKENIDILVATDCISEGQNLQDCDYLVNYDIHWNPVRIIQRFGRIDRIGSKNKSIQLVNFWPDIELDEYINLKGRVESRMKAVVMTSTGDDNPIAPEEPGDLDYRRDQLKRLHDEVVDLEEMNKGVSIMDLGLNEFRQDLIEYMKNNPDIDHTPHGLHAVVEKTENLPEGVIFVLKNKTGEINIGKKNRLHPFYMVYLDKVGNVVTNYLAPKDLLDNIRALAKNRTEPILPLCRAFNRETADGKRMDAYSKLLDRAVESIVDVRKDSAIDSFLGGDQGELFDKVPAGLDDFELISFFVVK